MRPRNLDEYVGQDHIIGPGRLLRRAIQADQLSSVIFYGPPGTGKTTLARVIANHTKSNFVTLNAVLAGVQQIRESIAQADDQRKLYQRRTILFVDEVHRWNRAQQDALLPWVENGTIILIGATTENPFFDRITSYNVCYTKLLRIRAPRGNRDANKRESVRFIQILPGPEIWFYLGAALIAHENPRLSGPRNAKASRPGDGNRLSSGRPYGPGS